MVLTFEECCKSASKFSVYREWREAEPQAVKIAKRKLWYNQVTRHMTDGRSEWSLVKCIFDAMQYDCVSDWRKASGSAYSKAQRSGWLSVCIAGYANKVTFADCVADAKKYKTRTEWQLSGGHYYTALRNGWREVCCAHMQSGRAIKWDKQTCLNDAMKYKSRYEWFSAPRSGYAAAKRLGVFDECVKCFVIEEPLCVDIVKLVA